MKPMVLIVDDEPINVKILAAILEANDYQVRSAFSGEDCLRRVAEETPDVILLDIMMPGMDGFAVARQLKESETSCFIPVIMVTALSDVKSRIQALDAGADDFLSKPADKAELLARVKASVKVRAYHEEMRKQQRGKRRAAQQDIERNNPATRRDPRFNQSGCVQPVFETGAADATDRPISDAQGGLAGGTGDDAVADCGNRDSEVVAAKTV